MAKRKSKRFAGSPEFHAAAFSAAAHALASEAEEAHGAMALGRCLAAGKKIDRAYEIRGRASAHLDSLNQVSHDYDTSDDQAMFQRGSHSLARTDATFEKVCVRAKPSKR